MKSFFPIYSSFGDETTTLCGNVGHLSPCGAEATTVETSGTCHPVTPRPPVCVETSDTCRPVTRRPLCMETSGTCRSVTRRPPLIRNVGHLSPCDAVNTVETSGTCRPVTRRPLIRNVGHLSPCDAVNTVETSGTCRPVTRRPPLSKRRTHFAHWRGGHHSFETSGTCRPVTRRPPLSKRRTHFAQWRGAKSQQIGGVIAPLRKRKSSIFLKLHFRIALRWVFISYFVTICVSD